MARSVEVLITGDESLIGSAAMKATAKGASAAGMACSVTNKYHGGSDWLCMFGVGSPNRNGPRLKHVERGGLVACWDLGYTGRGKNPEKSYVRVSVNHTHPQALLDETPPDPSRWDAQGIALRNDFDRNGHIVVAGMGPKSRIFLGIRGWEEWTLRQTQKRFLGRQNLYRPKPQGPRDAHINWKPSDGISPIEDVLRGAAMAVCRHSNVAVDACIAGVPVECEDGAAHWLYRGDCNPGEARRLDFLRRLAWWQWRCGEMAEAWRFLDGIGHA